MTDDIRFNWVGDYQRTYELCKAFRKLGNAEFQVFDFLFKHDVFEGSFTDIANAIGLDVSNTRKAALGLNKLGVIVIGLNHSTRYFYVIDGWYETILHTSASRPDPLSNIRRPRKRA